MIHIGEEKQLFIDDYCLEEQHGTRRQFHQAKKHPANPVLAPEMPWERAAVQAYGNVLYDKSQGVFQLWYNAGYEPAPGKLFYSVCHAVSTDGLHWQHSELNRLQHNGLSLSNAMMAGPYRGPTVLYTPEDPVPNRRYRMFVYTGTEILDHSHIRPGFMAYSVLFSPDGLTWTPYEGNPVVQGGDIGTCCYDPVTREYLAFHKVCRTDEGFYRRCVGVSVSENFLQWSAPIQILTGDAIDDQRVAQRLEQFKDIVVFNDPSQYNGQMYGMTGLRYEGLRLGLIWFYDVSGLIPQELGGNDDGVITTQLAYSRAQCPRTGWKRAGDRYDFIPCGGENDPDGAYSFVSHSVVEFEDELWFYYNGSNRSHGWFNPEAYPQAPQPRTKSPVKPISINLATLRRDGFASINAQKTQGRFMTRALTFAGTALEINADAINGQVAVEVQDPQGHVVPGFEKESCIAFRGDAVRGKIAWKEGRTLAALQEKPVRLVFHLRDARLYAFKFIP